MQTFKRVFLSEHRIPGHNPDGSEQLYKAGVEYELSAASAERWDRRGATVSPERFKELQAADAAAEKQRKAAEAPAPKTGKSGGKKG